MQCGCRTWKPNWLMGPTTEENEARVRQLKRTLRGANGDKQHSSNMKKKFKADYVSTNERCHAWKCRATHRAEFKHLTSFTIRGQCALECSYGDKKSCGKLGRLTALTCTDCGTKSGSGYVNQSTKCRRISGRAWRIHYERGFPAQMPPLDSESNDTHQITSSSRTCIRTPRA